MARKTIGFNGHITMDFPDLDPNDPGIEDAAWLALVGAINFSIESDTGVYLEITDVDTE